MWHMLKSVSANREACARKDCHAWSSSPPRLEFWFSEIGSVIISHLPVLFAGGHFYPLQLCDDNLLHVSNDNTVDSAHLLRTVVTGSATVRPLCAAKMLQGQRVLSPLFFVQTHCALVAILAASSSSAMPLEMRTLDVGLKHNLQDSCSWIYTAGQRHSLLSSFVLS